MSRNCWPGCRCRRGSLTLEWILLFTLLLIGAVTGFVAVGRAVIRQQDSLGTSVEGMNFPADSGAAPVAPLIPPLSSGSSP